MGGARLPQPDRDDSPDVRQRHDRLHGAGSRDEVYGLVRVIVHPTRVDSAATTVLFSPENTSTLINAGATLDTRLSAPYWGPVDAGCVRRHRDGRAGRDDRLHDELGAGTAPART